MILYLFMDIVIAYLLDLLFGDPYWLPHPVRFIGWLIKNTEKVLVYDNNLASLTRRLIDPFSRHNPNGKPGAEKVAGIVLAVFVVSVTFILVFILLKLAALAHPLLFHIVNVYFIYSSLAARCLGNEALKVYDAVRKEDIAEARKRLSMLVGRQTEHLEEEEIIRGVVETTAENTVDGVVSPLFYAIIGSLFGIGAPLAYAFKAVSTLDSMVGYMNERYLHLGCASAKTDDAANYIPARLTGLLIPLSAFFCKKDFRKSFAMMIRDRRNHKSPNCAYAEAAVAGALGIRIGGNNVYFGKLVEKPTIGDAGKKLEMRDITDTVRLMYVTSLLALMVIGGLAMGLVYIIKT